MEILRDIERVSKLTFTGIVHNPNLGGETTERTIADAADFARRLSALSGLPIAATAFLRTLRPLPESVFGEPWPMDMFRRKDWVIYDT